MSQERAHVRVRKRKRVQRVLWSALGWTRSFLPYLILVIAGVYIVLTFEYFWANESMPSPNTERLSFQEAVFHSPQIVRMFQAMVFYLIPLSAITIFLYFIFSLLRLRLRVGEKEMEIISADQLDQIGVAIEEKTKERLEDICSLHCEKEDRILFQIQRIRKFLQTGVKKCPDFLDVLLEFLACLWEMYQSPHQGVNCAFYVITHENEAYDLDLCGMRPLQHPNLEAFLNEIWETERGNYCMNLDTAYDGTPLQEHFRVNEVLGMPLFTQDGEMWAITIVYSQLPETIFSATDLELNQLLCFCLEVFTEFCKEDFRAQLTDVEGLKDHLRFRLIEKVD